MIRRSYWIILALLLSTLSCSEDDSPVKKGEIKLVKVEYNSIQLSTDTPNQGIEPSGNISISFSISIDKSTIDGNLVIVRKSIEQEIPLTYQLEEEDRKIVIPVELEPNESYVLNLSNQIQGFRGESFSGQSLEWRTKAADVTIEKVTINEEQIGSKPPQNISLTPGIVITFSSPVEEALLDKLQLSDGIHLLEGYTATLSSDGKELTIQVGNPLDYWRRIRILVGAYSSDDITFEGSTITFYTGVDETPKFPQISQEELMTKVQESTFNYFWDFAHPVCGLARERNTSGNTATIGGSGFGLMAILVGIERGFITRSQGIERLNTIVDFLTTADRFHGVWPHWMDGNTGKVIPFSTKDNGGDLVETSYMIQGLLTVREYLDLGNPSEKSLKDKITALWEDVDWDWYTHGGQNVLYWHWSPNYEWDMNMPIRGYDEALIVYVLAASSPTHPIDAEVYHQGWAQNGGIENGNKYYDITLPLGSSYGGPLFFAHYSFLGLDPRDLVDTYANYWDQNVAHSKINQAYCIENPKKFVGYSDTFWGLTASDNKEGYSAHSPTNDIGVITPTAALSSMPYTPEASLNAMEFFYYTVGDRLWGEYGFYDAINPSENWTANSYLAIDQGPIVVMIENYRTGLLWDLFMKNEEIKSGLDKLGFTSY